MSSVKGAVPLAARGPRGGPIVLLQLTRVAVDRGDLPRGLAETMPETAFEVNPSPNHWVYNSVQPMGKCGTHSSSRVFHSPPACFQPTEPFRNHGLAIVYRNFLLCTDPAVVGTRQKGDI